MSCMCGDTGCWSCGPAQGFDPAWETEYEEIMALPETTAFLYGLQRVDSTGNDSEDVEGDDELLAAWVMVVFERGIQAGLEQAADARADEQFLKGLEDEAAAMQEPFDGGMSRDAAEVAIQEEKVRRAHVEMGMADDDGIDRCEHGVMGSVACEYCDSSPGGLGPSEPRASGMPHEVQR